MSEIIHEGFVKDVFVLGEVKGKVETIISILNVRFKNIPTEVNQSLGQMTDPTALDSLVVLAATCDSIGEFAEALR